MTRSCVVSAAGNITLLLDLSASCGFISFSLGMIPQYAQIFVLTQKKNISEWKAGLCRFICVTIVPTVSYCSCYWTNIQYQKRPWHKEMASGCIIVTRGKCKKLMLKNKDILKICKAKPKTTKTKNSPSINYIIWC